MSGHPTSNSVANEGQPPYRTRSWAYRCAHPEQRVGQAAFNYLYSVNPALANTIRATELDPFYDNGKVEAFLEHLEALGVR